MVLRAIHRKVFFKRTNHMTEYGREGEDKREERKEKGEKEQG